VWVGNDHRELEFTTAGTSILVNDPQGKAFSVYLVFRIKPQLATPATVFEIKLTQYVFKKPKMLNYFFLL